MSSPSSIGEDGGPRTADDFAERYRDRLLAYLDSGDEADLAPAYELSRAAVANSLGLLDLIGAHRTAVAVILPEQDAERRAVLVTRAYDFLQEALAAFEIAHRGYVEAQESARAQEEHARKLRAIAEVSAALNASLPVAEILDLVTAQACALLGAAYARARLSLDRPAAVARGTLTAEAGTPPVEDGAPLRRIAAVLTGRRGVRCGELEVVAPAEDAGAEAILIQLAQVASAAIENAQLYGLKREIAETLQRSLLPQRVPTIDGIELETRYVAAGDGMLVGGDFYDVFPTNGTTWGIAIGDVCGKGPHAAALTALVRYTLRAAALWERDPERIMRRVNEAILDQRSDYRFCTALYGELRRTDGGARIDLVTCGHPAPLLLRANGAVEEVSRAGTLLGVVADPALHVDTLELAAGDLLLLYTDGAVEVRSGGREVFGLGHLRALLGSLAGSSAQTVATRVEEAVVASSAGPPRDDLALIALRVA